MCLFLELQNVCKSCASSGMQNERQAPSKESKCWIECFLLGMKQNALLAVKCIQHHSLGVCLSWSDTRDYLGGSKALFVSLFVIPWVLSTWKKSVCERRIIFKTQTFSKIFPIKSSSSQVPDSRGYGESGSGYSPLGCQGNGETVGST